MAEQPCVARSARSSLLLAIAALALTAAPASAACPGADTAPTAGTIAQAQATTLCLLNEHRAQHGLGGLGRDATLESAATGFSHRMVAEHFFSHESPDGGSLRDRLAAYVAGLSGWAIGENIAYGTGGYSTPGSIVEMWMNSSGHRANILSSRFRAIGIGIAPGNPHGSGGATYTTDFGNVVRSAVGTAPEPVATPGKPSAKPKKRKAKERKAKRKRARGRLRAQDKGQAALHATREMRAQTSAAWRHSFACGRSGCPDLNWGPLRPERSALPGCATARGEAEGY